MQSHWHENNFQFSGKWNSSSLERFAVSLALKVMGCLHEKTRTGASFIPAWLFDFVYNITTGILQDGGTHGQDVHEAIQQMHCGWQSSQQLEECIGNHRPQDRRHTWYQELKADQPLTSNVLSGFTNPTSKNAKHLGATSTKKASRLQSGIFYYWSHSGG